MHIFGAVVTAAQHVVVGLELFGLGQPPCGDPCEGVPPQKGLHQLHQDAFDGVAVGDVARLVGQNGGQLPGRRFVPDVNGAQEGERSDFLPRADERIVAGPGNFGAAPQPMDAEDLPCHDAGDQDRSQQIKPQTENFGRYGETSALVGKHFARPDGEVGRGGGCGCDDAARPYGNPQQRNQSRGEGRQEQVEPAPAESDPAFEQDGVGRQQDSAADEHFEHVDDCGFHCQRFDWSCACVSGVYRRLAYAVFGRVAAAGCLSGGRCGRDGCGVF